MILKRSFFWIPVLIIAFSCSRTDKAVFTGKLENTPSGEMSYVTELRVRGSRIIDSARLDARFRYPVKLKSPGFYQLSFSTGESLSLLVSPGEKIRIAADMDDFYTSKKIAGSPNSEQINILHDSLRATVIVLNKIRAEYTEKADSLPENDPRLQELAEVFKQAQTKHHRYSVQFILNDLSSLANIAALYQEYAPEEYVFNRNRDLQYFKLVSDTLMKYHPEVRHVKALQERTNELLSAYNTMRLMQTKEPVSYDVPELNLPGPDGRPVPLSSLKGKLVLLTFWSYNQQESMQNTLELKKLYPRYRPAGFEIYQVSVDRSIEEFRNRLRFEELSWISVIDTAFPRSSTRSLYNVNSLPMNYLIDLEQQEILAKNLSPEQLEQSIQHLLTRKE